MVDTNLKILLLGDSTVGKTSLLTRYVENKFVENFTSTVGMDIYKQQINIDNKNVLLTIMDCCGQEKFKSISTSYYREADGIIFVFDTTKEETLKNIKDWLMEVKDKNQDGGFDYIIVGTKIDLKDIREVKKENVSLMFEDVIYIETSSKDGTNVNEAFEEITKLILKRLARTGSLSYSDTRKSFGSFHLNSRNEHDSKKKCCQQQ